MNTIAQIRRKTECPCLALFDLCSEIYTYSALNQCLPSLPTHVIFKTAFKTDLIQGTGVRGCYHFQSPLPHWPKCHPWYIYIIITWAITKVKFGVDTETFANPRVSRKSPCPIVLPTCVTWQDNTSLPFTVPALAMQCAWRESAASWAHTARQLLFTFFSC